MSVLWVTLFLSCLFYIFMASRLNETLGRVPPCTLFFIALCIIIFIIELFIGHEPFVLSAYFILERYHIHVELWKEVDSRGYFYQHSLTLVFCTSCLISSRSITSVCHEECYYCKILYLRESMAPSSCFMWFFYSQSSTGCSMSLFISSCPCMVSSWDVL